MPSRNAKLLTEEEVEAMWALFGPPPVLSSEHKEAYYALRNDYVAYYRPANYRHLSWIRELVDTQWDIFRQLRYRTAAIERYHKIRMYVWRRKADQIVQKRKNELRELLSYCHPAHEAVSSLQTGIPMLEAHRTQNSCSLVSTAPAARLSLAWLSWLATLFVTVPAASPTAIRRASCLVSSLAADRRIDRERQNRNRD